MPPPRDGNTPPTHPTLAPDNSSKNKNTNINYSTSTSTPNIPIAQRKPAEAVLLPNNVFEIDPRDGQPTVWPRHPSGPRIGGLVPFLSSMRTAENQWGLQRGGGGVGRGGRAMGASGNTDQNDKSTDVNAEKRNETTRGGLMNSIGSRKGGTEKQHPVRDVSRKLETERAQEKGAQKNKPRQSAKQKEKAREKEFGKATTKDHKDKQDKKSWLPALRRPPQALETLSRTKPALHAVPRQSLTPHPAWLEHSLRRPDRSDPVAVSQSQTLTQTRDQDKSTSQTIDQAKDEQRQDPTDGRNLPDSPPSDPITYISSPVLPAALLAATPITPSPSPSPSPPKTGPTAWISTLKTKTKATSAVFDELFSFGAAVKRRPEKYSPPVSPRSSLEGGRPAGGLASTTPATDTADWSGTVPESGFSTVREYSDADADEDADDLDSDTSTTPTITAASYKLQHQQRRQPRIDSSSSALGFPFGTTSPARSRRGRELGSVKPRTRSSGSSSGHKVMGMLACEQPFLSRSRTTDDVHPGQRVNFGAVGCDFLFLPPPEGTLGAATATATATATVSERDRGASAEYHGWLSSLLVEQGRRSTFPTEGRAAHNSLGDLALQDRIKALESEASALTRKGVRGSEAARRRVCNETASVDEATSPAGAHSALVAVSSAATVPVMGSVASPRLQRCVTAPVEGSVPMQRCTSDPCAQAFLAHIRESLEARRLASLRPVFADETQKGFWTDGPL